MVDFARSSLRSRRERKAWGRKPQVQKQHNFQPAKAGERTTKTHMIVILNRKRLPPMFMGWYFRCIRDPGAHAPGFMLTPAPQAKANFRHSTPAPPAKDDFRARYLR